MFDADEKVGGVGGVGQRYVWVVLVGEVGGVNGRWEGEVGDVSGGWEDTRPVKVWYASWKKLEDFSVHSILAFLIQH